jgi:AhpD family alkylhydroperoxidase
LPSGEEKSMSVNATGGNPSLLASASLRKAIPEPWAAFTDLRRTATAEGVLPGRIKEVLALAISVVRHCDGCIDHHARAAARLGASPEEVAEALAVALLMDGGPATVYGPRAWASYREACQAG